MTPTRPPSVPGTTGIRAGQASACPARRAVEPTSGEEPERPIGELVRPDPSIVAEPKGRLR
jgi:hypothetical protein